jgi:hypothetical protein
MEGKVFAITASALASLIATHFRFPFAFLSRTPGPPSSSSRNSTPGLS